MSLLSLFFINAQIDKNVKQPLYYLRYYMINSILRMEIEH